jgi:hypothetical protein
MKFVATYESAYCNNEMRGWTNTDLSGNNKVEFDKSRKDYYIF